MIDLSIQTRPVTGGGWEAFGELKINGEVVRRDVSDPECEIGTYVIFRIARTEQLARQLAERDIPFVIAMAKRDGKLQ